MVGLAGLADGGVSAALLASLAAATVGQFVRTRDPIAYGLSLLIIAAACLLDTSISDARRTPRPDAGAPPGVGLHCQTQAF